MWFDIKWRRRSDGGVNEAQGLTAEQAMFRLKGAIPTGGSVEVIAITPTWKSAAKEVPLNEASVPETPSDLCAVAGRHVCGQLDQEAARAVAASQQRLNRSVFGDGDGTAYEFPGSGDSGIGGA